MARTGLNLKIANTVLGNAPRVNANSIMFVEGAVASTEGAVAFELEIPYLFRSVDDLTTHGITQENNVSVYNQVTGYFAPTTGVNNTGNFLWLVGVPEGTDSTTLIVESVRKTVVDGFQYRPRNIIISTSARVGNTEPRLVQAAIDQLYEEGFATVAIISANQNQLTVEGSKSIVVDPTFSLGEDSPWVFVHSNDNGLTAFVDKGEVELGADSLPILSNYAAACYISNAQGLSSAGRLTVSQSNVVTLGKTYSFILRAALAVADTTETFNASVGTGTENAVVDLDVSDIADAPVLHDFTGTFVASSSTVSLYVIRNRLPAQSPSTAAILVSGLKIVEGDEIPTWDAEFEDSSQIDVLANTLPDLANAEAPLVGVCLVTDTIGSRACVGRLGGFMSQLSPATSIGDMTSGIPFATTLYFLDAQLDGTPIATPCSSAKLTTVNTLGDKQYIFARTRPPQNGLWWNDGATCNPPENALSTLEAGRLIASVVDDAREIFTRYINSRVPVNRDGDLDGGYRQTVIDNADSRLRKLYVETGDMSDLAIELKAKDDNFVETRTWEVTIRILPAFTLRWVDGTVFYVKALD